MKPWIDLELNYARLLKEASPEKRKQLYGVAYGEVALLRMQDFTSQEPEERTAGTSATLVKRLAMLCSPSDDVLEIGCGRGYTVANLAPHVKSVTGIDVSPPSLSEAKELIDKRMIKNAELIISDAQQLNTLFSPHSFDKAISIDVIEHLHPDDAYDHYRQVYTTLKPGGSYIIVTPNRLTGPHDCTLSVFPYAKEPLGFHLNEVTIQQLAKQLTAVGFRNFRIFFAMRRMSYFFGRFTHSEKAGVFAEYSYKHTKFIPPIESIFSRLIGVKLIATK